MKITLQDGMVIEGSIEELKALGAGESVKESNVVKVTIHSASAEYDDLSSFGSPYVKPFHKGTTYEFTVTFKNGGSMRGELYIPKSKVDEIWKNNETVSGYIKNLYV